MTDFEGKIIDEERNTEQGSGVKSLDLSSYEPGYYELAIYSRFGPLKYDELARTSFSILEEHEYLPAEQSPFGMNIHSGRTAAGWTYALIKECYNIGAMIIRDDQEWAATESKTEKGKYSYSFPCADMIYNRNMDYIISTGFNHPLYDNNSTPYTDSGREGFANYSKALYDLYPSYTGGLKNMEVFNEWWGPQFGDRPDKGTVPGNADSLPETYVPLAKKVYETVKAEYPESVLFGEFGSEEWNRSIAELGILDYMDKAAIHIYPQCESMRPEESGMIEKYESLKNLLKEKSDKNFEIWVTETGMNTAENGYYNATEKEQAMYTPRLYFMFLASGVKKIFLYDLLDDGTTKTGALSHEDNFGLLRAKGSSFGTYTPKPAYVSYGVMTRMLDGKAFEEKLQSGDAYCYVFSGSTQKTSAVYSLTERKITIKASSNVTVTDLMGKKKTYTPAGGSFALDIGESVQYIDGDVEVIF